MMLRYEVSPLYLINLLFFNFVIEGMLSRLGERLKYQNQTWLEGKRENLRYQGLGERHTRS